MTNAQLAHSVAKTNFLQAKDFRVGDKIRLFDRFYKNGKIVFTVTKIYDGGILCSDSDGRFNHNSFDNDNLQFYGDKVKFVSRPLVDFNRLIEANAQLIASKVLLCDETDGARWIKATEKAFTEILENDTIEFDGEILTFVSRQSGKTRIVTKHGCHESCDCGGQISYHISIWELLSRCQPKVLAFPIQTKSENQTRMVA